MQFKPSAGIFVAGIVISTVGTLVVLVGMNTSNSDGGLLSLLGFVASVVGVVLVCIGASRALAIIDAIPAAFRYVAEGQAHTVHAPQQPNQQFSQHYPEQPYTQPPNQGYQQPPAQ